MDKACFGVTNHFKYRNRLTCFKHTINLPVKIFAEPSFHAYENDFFRLLEDEIHLQKSNCL